MNFKTDSFVCFRHLLLITFILQLFITNINSITLKCEITCDTEYQVLGTICRCKVVEFNSISRETITDVRHEGSFNGNYSDIKLILIDGQNMKFIPSKIYDFFPNIQGLIIDESNLSSIDRNDLKYFKTLKFLFIGNNQINSLDDNLFADNLDIVWLTYINNYSRKIGQNILNPLINLNFANFQRNSCINFKAIGKSEIEKLKKFIIRDCA